MPESRFLFARIAAQCNRRYAQPDSLYGLPENIAIWSEESPAWEVPAGSKDAIVIRYPDDHVLASGWLLGESYIKGRAALVEVPIGQGRAVLFGFRPQYRAQSYQAFKLFFNSLVSERAVRPQLRAADQHARQKHQHAAQVPLAAPPTPEACPYIDCGSTK